MIRDQAKSWVSQQYPVQAFRQMRDSGITTRYAPETWRGMVELGWTGMIIPEQYGGSDLGYLTFGIVLEEIGRQLVATPLFASALVGATAIMLGGTEEHKQTLLPKIVDGSAILTIAIDEGPHHNPGKIQFRAERRGSVIKLSGNKVFVHEGVVATHFVVVARCEEEIALFIVDADVAGLSRSAIHTMDSRGYASVRFDDVEVDATAQLEGSAELLEAVLDRARAGMSAEMFGSAAQCFDMTLEYLKAREQFGRIIGSFQALGHRAAELFGKMELSRSCMEAALQAIDNNDDNVAELTSLSKAKVGDFLHEMTNQMIQIHGGIGMTDEFDAGFYLKRARVLETTFGSQGFHRERYARLLGF